MRANLDRCVVLLGVVVFLGVGLSLVWPHAVGVYHLEVGGRLLEVASYMPDPSRHQAAIAHLQRAIEVDDRDSHAYRLLGQAYMANEQPVEAAEALKAYTVLRPRHPLGHLELAQASREAEAALSEMRYADLVYAAAAATLSDPVIPLPHPFEANDYVYTTTLDLFSPGERLPALFLHPVSAITYTLSLTRPALLRFGMGNILYGPDSGSDGVTFEVFVENRRLFLEHLTPEMARRGWQEREVDLADYTGQTIRLRLMSTPGPAGDLTADWAVWGDPRIESPHARPQGELLRGGSSRVAWKEAGVTAQHVGGMKEAVRGK
jgi:hypothetical protein